ATSNLTPLFNRPSFWTPSNSAVDITQATRSIVWLNHDYIVVYDRATSLHAGLFKRFNLSLVTQPVMSGNVATETLVSGQQLFIQTLLPQQASLSAVYGAGNLQPIAELEPTQYIYTVEDLTKPVDTRFLHVLQGADPGAAMATATYVQSTSGTAFDGAAFSTTVVYFPVSSSGSFMATTFVAPAGVHTILVTGLAANANYGVMVQASGNGNVISVTPGSTGAHTDAAGVLILSF